jgi:hypothetical protein
MNDDDLMTAVRDRFDAVLMRAPAAQIMKRGRALRRRRHGGRLAVGTLAVSLGAGLGVPALTAGPSGTAASHQQATLAAWTVEQHPDGTIAVTIRRPENLAALQRKLATLGVLVTFVDSHGTPVTRCELLIQLRKRPHGTFAIQISQAESRRTRITVAQCAVAVQR